MPSRRPGWSALLVAGAFVLVASILVGQKLGDRVLLQTKRAVQVAGAGVTPIPSADASDRNFLKDWKRLQVVAVATDPAFPDPRVTRPPTPRPIFIEPPPARRTPTPQPTVKSIYTPPPLPIPLVSHDPSETETEPPVPAPAGP